MLHASRSPLRGLGLAGIGVLIAVMSFPLQVAAGEAVDPDTLNPPLPASTNPTCGWAGQQVICAYGFGFTVTDAPTGIICDGGEIFESSDRYVSGQRIYGADLNLRERRFRERIAGVLYNSATGASVRWTGYDTGIQTLSVPGDRDTGVLVSSGAMIHLFLSDGRSVVIAGRLVENFDTGGSMQVGSNPGYDLCDAIV